MALQGTLETFSVPEVLRLLAGTRKTGLLALEGDRGVGNVWLAEGRIVRAVSDREQGEQVEAVLFDLLRFTTGSFVFESDAEPSEPATHDLDVDETLTSAEQLLDDWRDIESVIPSLDVHVQMISELDGESVTVTADQWRMLALVGHGVSARRIADHLELGELAACRLVHDLVVAGLVDVSIDLPSISDPEPVSDLDRNELSADEVDSLSQNLAGFVARGADDERAEAAEVVGAHEASDTPTDLDDESFEPAAEPAAEEEFQAGQTAPAADDFLSQLANLSPKAAAAIEATSDAGFDEPADDGDEHDDYDLTFAGLSGPSSPADAATELSLDEEPTEAASAEPDGDEEINRNLLLKFLSSAKN